MDQRDCELVVPCQRSSGRRESGGGWRRRGHASLLEGLPHGLFVLVTHCAIVGPFLRGQQQVFLSLPYGLKGMKCNYYA